MIFYDFEVFKHDWMVCLLDTDTRTMTTIINDKELLQRVYDKYKNTIWIGYNSRGYDQWILKGILAGFDPYKITDWIINKGRKGHEYSRLLSKFPLINYDTSVGFRSLKECEAFMGHDVRETTVPFDIDRQLTKKELEEVEHYCKHDVMETFEVFVETKDSFESHLELVKEFKLNPMEINKTQTQLASIILGATKRDWNDERDIQFSPNIKLTKYKFVRDWFEEQLQYDDCFDRTLDCEISGIPTRYAWGGVHGAVKNVFEEGLFVLSDINSMYPSMKIKFNLVSRNVSNPSNYVKIYDRRFELKRNGIVKEGIYKLVLNKAFGGMLDKYNALYDPRNGRSVCVNGQLALTRLLEMVEHICEPKNLNTDGILVKIRPENYDEYIRICGEWEKETQLKLGHDRITKLFSKDVNNIITVFENGKVKAIGAFVKKLSRLDYHLPIVNKAIRAYLLDGVPVEKTILGCDDLIEFQFVTKVSGKYDYAVYNDQIMHNKVYRVFASLRDEDGTLYKKHKSKDKPDKTAGTPDKCFINNENIVGKKCPSYLDKNWYVNLAKERIAKFLGE